MEGSPLTKTRNDVHDRRIGKWVDADGEGAGEPEELWTAYDGDNPYADFDAAGSLKTRYLYGPAIDQLFARIHSGEDIDWYLTDHLGSVRQIVDSQDNVIDELAYDSFGQVLSETNPANGDRFKYTSREWDAETEQYYYRARYYGADVGRCEPTTHRLLFTDSASLSFCRFFATLHRLLRWQSYRSVQTAGCFFSVNSGVNYLHGQPAVAAIWR